jgi:two-component system, OmpR family, sensor kinase
MMMTTTPATTTEAGGSGRGQAESRPAPGAPSPDPQLDGSERRRPGWRRQLARSARSRILAAYVILLAFSTVVSVAVVRQVLIARLDVRVQETLVQEAEEFRRLAAGRDPATGRAFGGQVRRIFDVYLSRNVPSEGEELITLLRGRPYRSANTERVRLELERDPELVRLWSTGVGTRRGEIETVDGPAHYLSLPVSARGRRLGSFVVVNFIEGELEEIDEAVQIAGGVGLAVLLVASVIAYFAAGRVLAPLRELSDTAQAITESDLTRRISVEGDDEIAELARTFNGMLDRLQDAFASQRAFVSDAGHELRTPITIVRGHLELLGDDPVERQETLDLVTDELDRMSRFVDELVLLARVERPDFLRLERVELGELMPELFAKTSALAERDWRLDDGRARGTLSADRQRLTQAVVNLAENAARHTGEQATITLGAALARGEARLWVDDTGPGVPVDEQERIFERFSRGPGGGRDSSGSGLGLTIVRAIAEAHGGRVDLDSRPGSGARFTIVIPADRHHEADR